MTKIYHYQSVLLKCLVVKGSSSKASKLIWLCNDTLLWLLDLLFSTREVFHAKWKLLVTLISTERTVLLYLPRSFRTPRENPITLASFWDIIIAMSRNECHQLLKNIDIWPGNSDGSRIFMIVRQLPLTQCANLLFWNFVAKNCMEIKEFGPRGGCTSLGFTNEK